MIQFHEATKEKARGRLALLGPAGSGKTYTALSIAKHLVPEGKIVLIDSEHGSASKYADLFKPFQTVALQTFSPDIYVEAIHSAEAAGFDVIIIDGLSQAWAGKEGALEQVDRIAARKGNKFTAWGEVTPKHVALIEAMLASPCHIIATMRTKMDYVLEQDPKTGKQIPRKVGMAPIQREGMEYEFDVVGDLDMDNVLLIGKTRCPALKGKYFEKPGKEVAEIFAAWLSDGREAPAQAPAPATTVAAATPPPASASKDMIDTMRREIIEMLGALVRAKNPGLTDSKVVKERSLRLLCEVATEVLKRPITKPTLNPTQIVMVHGKLKGMVLAQAEREKQDADAEAAGQQDVFGGGGDGDSVVDEPGATETEDQQKPTPTTEPHEKAKTLHEVIGDPPILTPKAPGKRPEMLRAARAALAYLALARKETEEDVLKDLLETLRQPPDRTLEVALHGSDAVNAAWAWFRVALAKYEDVETANTLGL